jgi:hypothetical protein
VFKGAGFLIFDSPFPAGRFRSVLPSRAVYSAWKKNPHPSQKTVKSAAPENPTCPQTLAHPPRKLPHLGEQYSVGG